jgi:ethanolamine ammonia-lyase small subunit
VEYVEKNNWDFLSEFTQARIAIGRVGTSLPTHFLLQFRLEHAKARDAVYSSIDKNKIIQELQTDLPIMGLCTQATHRLEYLKYPHQGRRLDLYSLRLLENYTLPNAHSDVVFVIADGLSASAVNVHASKILNQAIPYLSVKNWKIAPICIVEQGRVACADEIGEMLRSKIAVILIGERPGLSASDSLGIYITYEPKVGTTDEKRNCISNIRPEGLPYEQATQKFIYLLETIHTRQLSGVHLKDEQDMFLH